MLNLCQKADSKAHHTKTLFNIHKPQTLQGSAPQRKQKEIGNLYSQSIYLVNCTADKQENSSGNVMLDTYFNVYLDDDPA